MRMNLLSFYGASSGVSRRDETHLDHFGSAPCGRPCGGLKVGRCMASCRLLECPPARPRRSRSDPPGRHRRCKRASERSGYGVDVGLSDKHRCDRRGSRAIGLDRAQVRTGASTRRAGALRRAGPHRSAAARDVLRRASASRTCIDAAAPTARRLTPAGADRAKQRCVHASERQCARSGAPISRSLCTIGPPARTCRAGRPTTRSARHDSVRPRARSRGGRVATCSKYASPCEEDGWSTARWCQ